MTRNDNQCIKAEALRRANELRREAFNAVWDRLVAALGSLRAGSMLAAEGARLHR
ncbi:MAG: hypothetical protein HY854_01280 [Burkholderiales bacterium]|nr:hypothetical protein [Burkholderiales bacterium]